MAEEWVSARRSLAKDPKTICITNWLSAHQPFRDWLGVTPEALQRDALRSVTVVGFIQIWAVANNRAMLDGDDAILIHCDFAAIDEIAGVPGISQAMATVNWLQATEVNGVSAVRLPNFREYNITVEEREDREEDRKEKNRIRQQRFREKRNARNAAVTLHNAPTEQNRTEQNSPSFLPSKSPPPDPGPEEGRMEGEISWQGVVQRLGRLGVAEAILCAKRARDACGWSTEFAMQVLDYAEAHSKEPGAIYFRFGRPLPRVEDGWPVNGEATRQAERDEKRAEQRRLEEANSLAIAMVKKLRRQKKSDDEIHAALAANGLEWPK